MSLIHEVNFTKEEIRQYGIALISGFILSVLLSLYLFLRRGYYDLYIDNKVFAGVSLMLLGTTFLIGPFSRLYSRFDSWVMYRKEIGIIAFFFALLHSLISFFFLPNKFPLTYFEKNILTFIFGLTAILVLIYLFILSFERVIKYLDRKRWWLVQNWGIRIAGLLVFLHVFIMKYPGWIKWYIQGGGSELARPYLPPASLVVSVFAFYVIVVRLSEFFGEKIARIIVMISFILLFFFLLITFLWGELNMT